MTLATSQVQKHFQMNSLKKRSKNVLDLQKMNSKQLRHEIDRRKPTQSVETLDTRVDSSFMNASDIRNLKLDQDISRFKKRYQNDEDQLLQELVQNIFGDDEGAKEYVRESKKIAKGPDWSKMRGRSNQWERKPAYNNQDRFCNYNFNISPNKSKSVILRRQKHQGSKLNTSIQNMEQFDSVKIGKISQDIKFDAATLKCLLQYDKKDRYRKFSRALPPIQMKQLDPQKINLGKKLTSPCKNSHIHQFYLSQNVQTPHQMAIRLNKDNEFYYPFKDERYEGDIGARMRKQKMLLQRVNKILSRKEIPDVRGQLCDEKFFKRRQLKMQK